MLNAESQLIPINAANFGQVAAQVMTNHKDDWNTVKSSMVDWLRTNVGSNVNSSLSNLEDLVIKSAADNAYQAQDYLKDTKRSLLQLMQDPYAKLTMHNDPPRSDSDDGISWDIPTILGWNDPTVSNQTNSGGT